MAPRRAASAKQRLLFSQRLTKDSKLTTAELLKRLHSLHKELEKLEQDNTDTDSLGAVRKELISPGLLVHRDRSVKALVACCLADLLRLYAPDAPYTEAELKDIFQFFFRQLKNFTAAKDQDTNQEYFYLVESLANVQSIVLITDITGSDELMTEAFKTFFDIVNTDMTKNIPIIFADLMHQIVTQAGAIPASVLESLLAQFHPTQAKRNPAAYRLAADVANACDNKLQRDVCRYFSEILLAGANALGARTDDEEDEDEKDANDLEDIKTAHALIKSLHKAAPGVLLNVIPQLQEELQVDTLELRLLATQTLADMISDVPSSSAVSGHSQRLNGTADGQAPAITGPAAIATSGPGDIPNRYPTTWRAWLGRAKDKLPQVRIAVIEAIPKIWPSRPLLSHQLGEVLAAKLEDPDDKVRVAACRAIESLDFETVLHRVDGSLLKALGERCTDKKYAVQEEAFKVLGKLYHLAYSTIEQGDAQSIRQFGWIPKRVLACTALGDPRLLVFAERCFYGQILPLPKSAGEDGAAVDRLLVVAKGVDEHGLLELRNLARVMEPRPSIFDHYLDACEANNGGTIDDNVEKVKADLANVTRVLAAGFPDANKANDDLTKFAAMNDQRIYKLLRTLADPQTDFKALIKTHQECLRRLEGASPTIVATFTTLVERSSFLILNRSSVPNLLDRLRSAATDDDDQRTNVCAKFFLDAVSKGSPRMMTHHAGDLVKALAAEDNEQLAQAALLALSELVKVDHEAVPADKRMIERATHFATNGNLEQAKCAATILSRGASRRKACAAMVERVAKALSKDEPAQLVGHLSALASVAKHAVDVFDQHSKTITSRALVLLTTTNDEEEGDDEWPDESDVLDSTRARVLSLKVLTNRCRAYADAANAAKETSAPVFKLLWQILDTRDQIGTAKHSPATAARLRLAAAFSVLKLATHKAFAQEVENNLTTLAWLAQDPCYTVRESFLTKLVKYLQRRKLVNPNFNLVLFLVAHDPEKEIIQIARASLVRRYRAMPLRLRTMAFELILVRLLRLLAHHPDFSNEPEDILTYAKYIDFYADCIASQENVPLLYHLAGKLKGVRDASQNHTNYLYVLSELAQHILKARATAHGWSLTSYPGKITLPANIFRPLPNQDIANQIMKKTFLPDQVVEDLRTRAVKKEKALKVDGEGKKKKPPKDKVEKIKATPKKRKTPTKKPSSAGKKKTKRRKKDWEGEDDDVIRAEDSSSDSDSDEGAPSRKRRDTSEKENAGTKSRPRAKPKPSAGAVAAQAAKDKTAVDGDSELSDVDAMDVDA